MEKLIYRKCAVGRRSQLFALKASNAGDSARVLSGLQWSPLLQKLSTISLKSQPACQPDGLVTLATPLKFWPHEDIFPTKTASLLAHQTVKVRVLHIPTSMLPKNLDASLHPWWRLVLFLCSLRFTKFEQPPKLFGKDPYCPRGSKK